VQVGLRNESHIRYGKSVSKWTDLQHQSLKIHPTVNDTVNLIDYDDDDDDNNNNNNNVPIQVDDCQ